MPTAPPTYTLQTATPVFLVSDIAATMRWYRDTLGFDGDAVPKVPPHNFGILRKNGVSLFLQQLTGYSKADRYRDREGGVWSAYLRTEGVRDLYDALKTRADVTIVHSLHTQPYGETEFEVRDPNGYLLVFAERL
jgi:catechol 2,3-dioxygenase-like lactoylglutathione lyase family enzyme